MVEQAHREAQLGDTERVSGTLADPVRLALLRALFRIAQDEHVRRRAGTPTPAGLPPEDAYEAARLDAAFRAHMAGLDAAGLERERGLLAQALLLEVDRRMAKPGTIPGRPLDFSRVPVDVPSPPAGRPPPRVGLVSLPWMSPAMPSIQLATLSSALGQEGIRSDVHELYVDYAARIGLNLYSQLDNVLGFLPEWVFSRHYYGPEHGDDLAAMLEEHPLGDLPFPDLADAILEALEPVTARYLDDMVEQLDWSQYDVVGCSLTISQLGASMAFARRLKLLHRRSEWFSAARSAPARWARRSCASARMSTWSCTSRVSWCCRSWSGGSMPAYRRPVCQA